MDINLYKCLCVLTLFCQFLCPGRFKIYPKREERKRKGTKYCTNTKNEVRSVKLTAILLRKYTKDPRFARFWVKKDLGFLQDQEKTVAITATNTDQERRWRRRRKEASSLSRHKQARKGPECFSLLFLSPSCRKYRCRLHVPKCPLCYLNKSNSATERISTCSLLYMLFFSYFLDKKMQ